MNFSIAQVWVDSWVPVGVYGGVVALYVVAAAMAGRRFGARGIWGACAAWTLFAAGAGVLSVPPGEQTGAWVLGSVTFALLAAAAPGAASAALMSRLARAPRPAALPLQMAAGVLAYLALPLAILSIFVLLLVILGS